MKNVDEDYAYEQRRQSQLDAEDTTIKAQWHQKVGTVVPFSRTVDKDPWKYVPLSIPQESPVLIEVWAWTIIAAFVGLAYWWVA